MDASALEMICLLQMAAAQIIYGGIVRNPGQSSVMHLTLERRLHNLRAY